MRCAELRKLGANVWLQDWPPTRLMVLIEPRDHDGKSKIWKGADADLALIGDLHNVACLCLNLKPKDQHTWSFLPRMPSLSGCSRQPFD